MGAPTFDRFGRAYLGLGAEQDATGRLLLVAADGTLLGVVVLAGAPQGGVTLAPGAIMAVTRSARCSNLAISLRKRRRPASSPAGSESSRGGCDDRPRCPARHDPASSC